MYVVRQGMRVNVSTPAKLNLFLELLSRRTDGFHELDTLMVPVDLFDSVGVYPREDGDISLSCRWANGYTSNKGLAADLPPVEDNIVVRALQLLRECSGTQQGIHVDLIKRIPSQAGMGGGSSDAMAALVAGNLVWNANLEHHQLAELGSQLGSDVPFFAFGQLARCTGRGEVIRPMNMAGQLHFVVVKPEFGLSTPAVYSNVSLAESPHRSDVLCRLLAASVEKSSLALRRVGDLFFNRLQEAARKVDGVAAWLDRIGQLLERLSVLGHQMSGSGSSYFALCRNRRHARFVAANLRASQLGAVFVVSSLGLKPMG